MRDRLVAASSVALLVIVGTVACAMPAAPSPTRSRTPTMPLLTAVPTHMPTATPSSPTSSPSPSSTPVAEPSSAQTVALYTAGSAQEARLFELTTDGVTADLGWNVYPKAVVSPDGRWIATPDGQLPADRVMVYDLEAGTTYTIAVTSDFDPYGLAFDSSVRRLAILEVGPPEDEQTGWALVAVDLEDGSTARFQETMGSASDLLPGFPIGWSGDDLLINTFVPFTEEGSAGLWSITLPPDATSAPIDGLDRRQILPGARYLFDPHLSPRATRLLYLNRDDDYTPDNYAPVGYDLAVNQLVVLDLDNDASRLLVEETEGGALGGDVAWSPDGEQGLFAAGPYGDGTFASLTLKTVDDAGLVSDVAPVPLPSDGFLVSLNWCVEDMALVVVATSEGRHELHMIDLTNGESSLVASDDDIVVLGCTRRAAARGAGNADVVRVRAVQTAGPEPGTGAGTWTFHVTVEHPDTGWEDYADGWDVVAPDGQVLKPDAESAFTRTLLHPHVDEQPFTRSQPGVIVPADVTEVRVRAHDIVDGYGGKEVLVDLTAPSGSGFEVER